MPFSITRTVPPAKMLRRYLPSFSLLLACVVLAACGGPGGFSVSIPNSQINAALAKGYPVSQTFFRIIDLTYSNPKAFLRPGSDRVELTMDAKLKIALLPGASNLTGTCTIDSGVRYQPQTAQLFLAGPELRKLEIQGLPQEYLAQVSKAAVELSRSRLEAHPISTLDGHPAAVHAAKLLVKDVRVRDGAVRVTFGF